MRLVAIAVMTCLALSGCASLSESECQTADWQAIGFTDGSKGRSADYLAQHRKACADVGITPNAKLWLAGRDEGLQDYCTPTNAYAVGRKGAALSPVCPAEVTDSLSAPYETGQRYHEITLEIQELERDLASTGSDLRRLDNASSALGERSRLMGERAFLRQRISELRRHRLNFSSWPQ